jgi:hypothetical protein
MRQLHERVLSAKGINIRKPLAVKGLRAYSAGDQTGSRLLFRGKIFGPTWTAMSKLLEHSDIEFSIVEAGKIWLFTADSERTRLQIEQLSLRAKQSASELVFVPDVGFVSAGIKKRFESETLVGPIAIALLSLGLSYIAISWPEQSQQETVVEKVSCALDLPSNELREWVASGITGRALGSPAKILVSSELGLLELEIEQTLGTTQSVSGFIECHDGRSKQLHYRLDASANGGLVELGQKLNP